MGIWQTYKALEQLALANFADIVVAAQVMLLPSGDPLKLRLQLLDDSFIDVYLSAKGRYSYHWERRLTTGDVYRHDNAPHARWQFVSTFPKHFHDGSEDNARESLITDDPPSALTEFLAFARQKLQAGQ